MSFSYEILSLNKLLQGLVDEEDNKVELVEKSIPNCNVSYVSGVKERGLVCAAFSGHLDPSIIVAAPGKNSHPCFSFLNLSDKFILLTGYVAIICGNLFLATHNCVVFQD